MNGDVLFKIKTRLSKPLLIDGVKFYLRKRKFFTFYRIFAISLSLIFGTLSMIWKHYGLALFFLFILIYLLYIHHFYHYILKKQSKYSYDLEQECNFYEDRLEIKTDIFNLIVMYSKVHAAVEKDKAFYLLFEYWIICIDKGAFVKEKELDNFKRFIRSKIVFE